MAEVGFTVPELLHPMTSEPHILLLAQKFVFKDKYSVLLTVKFVFGPEVVVLRASASCETPFYVLYRKSGPTWTFFIFDPKIGQNGPCLRIWAPEFTYRLVLTVGTDFEEFDNLNSQRSLYPLFIFCGICRPG